MDSVRYTYVFGHPIYELTLLLLLLLLQGSSFLYLFLCFRVGVGKKLIFLTGNMAHLLAFWKRLVWNWYTNTWKIIFGHKIWEHFFFCSDYFFTSSKEYRSLLAWLQVISENCFMLFLMIHYIIISLYHKHVRKSLFVKCRQAKTILLNKQ